MKYHLLAILSLSALLFACKKDDKDETSTNEVKNLIFRFKFDPNQGRLDNFGNPAVIPSGHSALTPVFNEMSAHYIELAPNAYTALGKGAVLYRHEETNVAGSNAIDFSKSIVKGDNEVFYTIPLKDVAPGSYEWLRVSLAYQNYDIEYKIDNYYGTGTLASFIGFNNYIKDYKIKTQTINVNENKKQGYWGFETTILNTAYVVTGQAPEGATTVPNPLSGTSPIPAGSCVVTGKFVDNDGNPANLIIPSIPGKNIEITVSLSVNKSFEWKDANMDGWYEPNAGDTVVDMGIRGLIPYIKP